MGRRKFRLSNLKKNLERKNKGQNMVGRPSKNVRHLVSPTLLESASSCSVLHTLMSSTDSLSSEQCSISCSSSSSDIERMSTLSSSSAVFDVESSTTSGSNSLSSTITSSNDSVLLSISGESTSQVSDNEALCTHGHTSVPLDSGSSPNMLIASGLEALYFTW